MKNFTKIVIALVIALLLSGLTSIVLDGQKIILIGTITFLIVLWTNEGLPLGAVSLLPILFFPSLGLNDLKAVTSNYSHPIIFLFLGGFLIALAFEKTNLHRTIAHYILKIFPKTPRGMIYSLMITSALLSAILSNTTITLMLMPIAMFLTSNNKLSTRFLIAIAYGASIGGVLTPIGTPPNLILLGFLEQANLPSFSFTGWMVLSSPVVATMLTIVPYMLSFGITEEQITENLDQQKFSYTLTPSQRKLLIILCSLVVLLLVNSRYGDFYPGLGLSDTLILLGFGLSMFFPGIGFLEWSDVKKIPFEIIFLFGAGFSIAATLIKNGLAEEITIYFIQLNDIPIWLLLLGIAFFVSFATQITSNTAFVSMALPIFFEFSRVSNLDYQLILPVVTIATSYAFMLPIATPPNAIVMSSNRIKIKEMASIGFFVNLTGVVVLSLIAYFVW